MIFAFCNQIIRFLGGGGGVRGFNRPISQSIEYDTLDGINIRPIYVPAIYSFAIIFVNLVRAYCSVTIFTRFAGYHDHTIPLFVFIAHFNERRYNRLQPCIPNNQFVYRNEIRIMEQKMCAM